MNGIVSSFLVGSVYSNDTISRSLGVGNAGGIRPNVNPDGSTRRLVLLTVPASGKVATENPYHDRIEGDTLIYTGKGLRGHQLGGVNERLREQPVTHFPIWGFQQTHNRRDKHAGKERWAFLGLLCLLRVVQEQQLDLGGTLRSVWVFELTLENETTEVAVEDDARLSRSICAASAGNPARDRSEAAPETHSPTVEEELQIERVRAQLLVTHPRDFEVVVKRALEETGYRQAVVTRYSQDGGIDVTASFGPSGWPVRPWQVQVQAKRWLHTVGRKEVAELRGSLSPNGLGCLVTTSHFSRAALSEANEQGKTPISLINGREFAKLLLALKIQLPDA